MCQKEEQKNGKIRLDLQIVRGLRLLVVTAKRLLKYSLLRKQEGITATSLVIQWIEKKTGSQKNRLHGKGELLHMKHIDVGLKNILNIWHISRQDGTPDKEMPKVRTLLKNGKNFAENIIGDVLNVKKERSSRKTISNLFQQVVVIISQISNHFVGIAIVGSGSFNIYENPELLTTNHPTGE